MVSYARIVCPTDFSETAGHALSAAVALSRLLQIPLELAHVVPPPPLFPTEPELGVALSPAATGDFGARRQQAEEQLQELAEHLRGEGVTVQWEVSEGSPGDVLLERYCRDPSTLFIIGTHGYRGFQKFVLGSTAIDLLRRASAPVMTVHSAPSWATIQSIGVGVDFSAACEPAIEAGVRLARAAHAQLHLVHIMNPVDVRIAAESQVPSYVSETHAAVRMAAMKELDDIADRIKDVDVFGSVQVSGNTYRSLVLYAQERQLDLLVLGTHGRSGLRRLFLGSVTERVLQLAPCPVLAVKLPQDVPAELSWRDVASDLNL